MADSRKGKRKVEGDDGDDGDVQQGKQAAGMAWGPSRALEAAQRRPRKDDEIGFGDFGRYMSEKIRKLREQFHGDASNSLLSGANSAVAAQHAIQGPLDVGAPSSKIFEGVSIYVDGFTVPSHQELRHLMLQYGGIFENYFARSRVTHVICSTLPDSKIKDPRLLSRGLPIVKPSWIVDSIKASKRLPYGGYELERIAYQHPNQRTISGTFFAQKDNVMSEKHGHLENLAEERERPVSDESHDVSNDPNRHIPMQPVELQMEIGDIEHVVDDEAQEDDDLTTKEEMQNRPEDVGAPNVATNVSTSLSEVTESKVPEVKESSSKAHSAHSTLGDPNFVHNYYKYSRLHFIGTWRNRYKDLFGTKGPGRRY